ncbi:MAG: hypothetical protein ACI4RP_00425, partial [Acutalibacteraceae bacterium]
SATAEIEAQFGNVYYAVCRTNVPFIIWNNGINGGLPTDPDFDLNRANAAKRTQDIYVEDPSYNSLGTTAEGAGDGYGVTDLCGCIAYVTGETTVENPLTGISETIYTVNWKFYDPKSGASTTTGLLDENGNLITYDVYGFGEAENPYYDLDYTFVPEIEFPEEKTTEPETDPIDPDSPQPSFGKPSFSGGTIYWECPWEVAQIAYCHVFGHEGSSLYDWQTKNEKMTREGGNLWSYEIPAGPYDLVIFSIDTGAQTYNLVLTDDCISKTAVSDTDTMIENPMDSNKVACRTTWKGVGPVVAGPHLAITSIGNIVGETLCPTESGAEMVAYFIYNFLPVNPDCVTAEVLNVAISKAGTTGEEVLAVLTTMRDFTMLDEAKELLGVGGGSDSEGYYYIVLDDDTIEITDYAGGDTELVIPCEIEGKLVTSIGERAFYDFSRIISITIPDSVTYIGNCAFGYYSVIHPPVYDPETGTSSKGYIEVVKIDGFTVYGYTGTAAEQYAKDNGFEFIALEPEVITGDASGDGVVDAKDRMLLS